MDVEFGVLGPVTAWDGAGGAIALKGPRHRAVLARLVVARGRVVPVSRLVEDLWVDPPPGAVGAVRTFVGALRRALEPQRPPRSPARLLITQGPGYALRAGPGAVDARRFEQAVATASSRPATDALAQLDDALGWWRGPAYAEFSEVTWARADRSRLAELRLQAVERQAEARLALGRAPAVVADLHAHVTEHPWREDAWLLLALAMYRAGRQGDALAVLRRARRLLIEHLGVDPGPRLRRLEADILAQADHLDLLDWGDAEAGAIRVAGSVQVAGAAEQVWARAAAAYDRNVSAGSRARLESTVGLLRNLATTGGGGLAAARQQRLAAIAAAEALGDAELTARVIGGYDVPALWTRSDDPDQSAGVVAAAERSLAALRPHGSEAARARLLATIALESRGTRAPRGLEAARRAEQIARRLDDPALLAFALNGVIMQTCHRAGLAPQRDEIGAELVALSTRHGLVTVEVLGHLIRLQARSALADFTGADRHAAAADRLAEHHELPLAGIFTQWYRALRQAATSPAPTTEARTTEVQVAYRAAAARLEGAGMPGVERGLLPLALLGLRVSHDRPIAAEDDGEGDPDWGPYEPWVRPLVLLGKDRRDEAAAALRAIPEPPRDLLFEAMWVLIARAAIALDDRRTMERARRELAPATGELAGAGSGLLTLGPVSRHLRHIAAALRGPR
ncbi:MAG: BTAD domain-containing putative transcriptional regulator [Frankia sp.]